MNETAEGRIRRWLDENGGTAEVPFHNLMTTWGVHQPSPADSWRIQEALRSAGVVTQPELGGLVPESRVRLTVYAAQAPPWQAPPAPEPQPQAPAPPQYQPQAPAPPQYQPQAPAPPQYQPQAPPAPEPQPSPHWGAAAAGRPAAMAPAGVAQEAATAGLAAGTAGAVLVLVSSFLPWVSAFDVGSSLWELAEILDVLLVLFALGALAATAATFSRPGLPVLRVATLALLAGLLSFVLVTPIEFIVSGEGEVSGTQAGEIVALLAAAALVAALVLQIQDLRPMSPPVPEGRNAMLLLAGLAALFLAGVAQPLVALLPVEAGVSTWEGNEIADVLSTLIALALAALAAAAILGRATPQLVAMVFALGAYVATYNLINGIESLAAEADGAGVLVALFPLAPLAGAGAALVALGSDMLRRGTRPSGHGP